MDIHIEESPNWLWLRFGSAAIKKCLRARFAIRPPDFFRAPSYQLYKRTEGKLGWNGYIDFVQAWDGPLKGKIMRGLKDQLLEICVQEGYTVTQKCIRSPFADVVPDDVPADTLKGLTLDHDQRVAVAGLLSETIGVIEATVSAGKTAIFLSCVCVCKRQMPAARWLYIVPTERLVNQVVKETKRLAPKLRISQFGGGVRDTTGADLVVATSASLSVNLEELTEDKWLSTFTGVIYDEVHRATSKSSQEFLQAIPAFFRIGGSDSVKDARKSDVIKGMTIRGLFGPVRHRILAGSLIDIGRLAKPYIYVVDIQEWAGSFDDIPMQAEPGSWAWCYDEQVGSWTKGVYSGPVFEQDADGKAKKDAKGEPIQKLNAHAVSFNDDEPIEWPSRWCMLRRHYEEAIMRFRARNELIVAWTNHWASKGPDWPTLVVCTRTLHIMLLKTLLEAAGLDVLPLTGEDSSKTRDKAFAWITEKHAGQKGRVLLTPLVKEGVSLPELRAGVVADYVSGPDTMRQILGRFIRKKPTGENHAHITVFVENQSNVYRRGSIALVKELERLRGYTYRWPCAGPDTINQAGEYQAAPDQ